VNDRKTRLQQQALEASLQAERLRSLGMVVDDDGNMLIIPASDVSDCIAQFENRVRSEARLLLALRSQEDEGS
jgi:hypothetical protein